MTARDYSLHLYIYSSLAPDVAWRLGNLRVLNGELVSAPETNGEPADL